MEFENIAVIDKGIVRIKEITITLTLYTNKEKEIKMTTSNRELIHLAINRQVLLNDFSRNSDFIYERILQILLRSDDISMDDKCLFEEWNYQSIKFKDYVGEKCTKKEKKLYYADKLDKIFERINGNQDATWREYINIISHDPCIKINESLINIKGINKN